MNFKIELKNFNDIYYLLHIDKIVLNNEETKKSIINFIDNLKNEISINHKDDEIISLNVNLNYDSVGINFPYQYLEHLFSERPLVESIIYIDKNFKEYDLNKIFLNEVESIIYFNDKNFLLDKTIFLEKIFNIDIKEKILKNKIYNRNKRIEDEIFLIQYSSKSIFVFDKVNDVQIVINNQNNLGQITIISEHLYSDYYFKDITNDFIYKKIFSIYSSIFNSEVNFNNISDYLNLSRVLNYN